MSTQTSTELEQMREVLELQRAEINGKLLTGYLPDGTAVEFAAGPLSVCFARRVMAAPADSDAPMRALEWLIERLNRQETTTRWEVRRRDRPRAIEVWLLTIVDRIEWVDETDMIRRLNTRLARMAEHERRAIQVLFQRRVATILEGYLSGTTLAGSDS
ncbi:MAG: hypothetical protein AAB658_17610 [Chloroflexota bacterium]